MTQVRKEYRKSFNSSGQLYVAGEFLDFIGYDVSVKGILVEVVPGSLLSGIDDFDALLKENNSAEIYVKDLMLTGETDIVWAKLENGKIMLGLEFRDVMYNAKKLWRKRRTYRSKNKFSGYLIADKKSIDFQGLNLSVDGMALKLDQPESSLEPGKMIKFQVHGTDSSGVAKIVWINADDPDSCVLGLKYLVVD